MLENIRLSFQGVWSHRLRSFLTMLGIIIGIAAIIAIVSTIKGTNEQIKKNLIGSGTNTTTVQITESGNYPAEMEYGIPKGIPVLDDAMREIESENKSLVGVLPKVYATPDLDKRVLGEVVDIFTNITIIFAGFRCSRHLSH